VLKGADVQGLADPGAENNSEGIPFRGIFGISFLNTFYSVVFGTDINRILEPIFIYGEFYSRDNRIKFIENYNELIKLEDDLQVFEQKISPSGVFGRQFINAKEDISDPRIRRRKLRQVVDDASRAAAEILDSAKRASSGMISVLEGILKIDILAKTPKLSGGKNEFTDGVAEAIEKFQKVIKILNDSDALDDN
jgi:hypothetical protein